MQMSGKIQRAKSPIYVGPTISTVSLKKQSCQKSCKFLSKLTGVLVLREFLAGAWCAVEH